MKKPRRFYNGNLCYIGKNFILTKFFGLTFHPQKTVKINKYNEY